MVGSLHARHIGFDLSYTRYMILPRFCSGEFFTFYALVFYITTSTANIKINDNEYPGIYCSIALLCTFVLIAKLKQLWVFRYHRYTCGTYHSRTAVQVFVNNCVHSLISCKV